MGFDLGRLSCARSRRAARPARHPVCRMMLGVFQSERPWPLPSWGTYCPRPACSTVWKKPERAGLSRRPPCSMIRSVWRPLGDFERRTHGVTRATVARPVCQARRIRSQGSRSSDAMVPSAKVHSVPREKQEGGVAGAGSERYQDKPVKMRLPLRSVDLSFQSVPACKPRRVRPMRVTRPLRGVGARFRREVTCTVSSA